jgi:glutathione synthase/RimK-type ligase-like ATP-grasp enzyme
MLTLVWGERHDPPVTAAIAALERLGAAHLALDQATLAHATVELRVGPPAAGRLQLPSDAVALEDVTSVYLRPGGNGQAGAGPAEQRLLVWTELCDATVVNRPSAMAANHSKPYQLAQLHRLGFAVPDTLVTTDPDAARRFWRRHGTVVYKSVSGVRSIVRRLAAGDDDRLDDVRWCPTQFQQHIAGVDHRVHVVGERVFAARITAADDDYRHPADGAAPQVVACRVPDALARVCVELARRLRLPLVGIDLRLTPGGAWYCFEANPSPAFTWYEQASGQPIAESLARLLAAPRPPAAAVR